jgi:hypothetical protein
VYWLHGRQGRRGRDINISRTAFHVGGRVSCGHERGRVQTVSAVGDAAVRWFRHSRTCHRRALAKAVFSIEGWDVMLSGSSGVCW